MFGQSFVDALDSVETGDKHHSEAIAWHWNTRHALIKIELDQLNLAKQFTANVITKEFYDARLLELDQSRKPLFLAYFTIWARGNLKCIEADTPILMADGLRKPIRDVEVGDLVSSWEETTGRMVARRVTSKVHPGNKECVRLRTRSDWQIIATPDHWVRTFEGWKRIKELQPTDRIASPRQTPSGEEYPISDEEIRLATYVLTEGGTTTTTGTGINARLTSADVEIIDDMAHCAGFLGFTFKKVAGNNYDYDLGGGARTWLRERELAGKKAIHKRLPEWFYSLSRRQVEVVIAAVLDTDGFIGKQVVGVTLASEGLIDDLRHLFLKAAIVTTRYFTANNHAGAWSLVFDNHNLGRLAALPLRLKQKEWAKLLIRSRYSLIDCYPQSLGFNLPKGENRRLRRLIGWRTSFKYRSLTRDKLQRAIKVLPRPQWLWLEQAEVLWDEVVSVEPVGVRETYDIEVAGTHNFIANGLVTHNTTIVRRVIVADACISHTAGVGSYALIVSGTKAKVRGTANSINALLTRPMPARGSEVWRYYPKLAEVKRSKFGHSQGWTTDFINTAGGAVFQFVGLDEGMAGANEEGLRPTLIAPDDIDNRKDSPVIAERNFQTLTTEILPMRQSNTLVFWAQNLISRFSSMYRVWKQQVKVLTNRVVTDPIPAVRDLVTRVETVGGIVKDIFISGRITWRGWNAQRVQEEIDTYGLPAFLRECQHDVDQSREGLVLQNWDDSVHVISISQFAAMFGTRELPRYWSKYVFNDWARTKTKYHANVAGIVTVSPQNTPLPGCVFVFHPMSFPAGSMPEDVALRLLKVISPVAKTSQREFEIPQLRTWEEVIRSALDRGNLERFVTDTARLIEQRRVLLSDVIPKHVEPVIRTQNYQVFRCSHERTDVQKVYRTVFGLPFQGINPGADGGTDTLNLLQRVDYDLPHPIVPNKMGYTRFFLVTPDSDRVCGGAYEPVAYRESLSPDDLVDDDLFRFQMRNWRLRDPYLTSKGEVEGEILKMNDDFGNGLMMLFYDGCVQAVPLNEEEKVYAAVPSGYHPEELQARTDLNSAQKAMTGWWLENKVRKSLKPKSVEVDDYGEAV